VVVGRWQGAIGELTGAIGRAPDKEGASGAHRGRRSTVRWRKQLWAAAFTGGGGAPVIGGGRLGLLQYWRKKARVRRGSIGAQSCTGVGRTEEGKIGSDDGLGNGEERRRCGHWRRPEAEREGEVWSTWMRGHGGEKEHRVVLHPFYRCGSRAVMGEKEPRGAGQGRGTTCGGRRSNKKGFPERCGGQRGMVRAL
jgi:hypothetical protein